LLGCSVTLRFVIPAVPNPDGRAMWGNHMHAPCGKAGPEEDIPSVQMCEGSREVRAVFLAATRNTFRGKPMSLSDEELAALFCSPSQLRDLADEDLMAALRMGCNDALAVLFERHSALVFRIARTILHDDGEAEETVQKVFLDIFRAVNQFNADRGTFKTWLLQYAYHRSIDRRQHLRANRFYSWDELDKLTPAELFYGPGHLVCLPPQEVVCLVEQVLATLESRQRRVIELTYFEGLTAEEIAKKTGDSASSVRHNLYRGLSKLRNVLQETSKAKENTATERKVKAKGMLVEQP
jgi:RNA polymerase sigma-70 factor (ECF subfamily)